jgi:hypothetical protein
MNENTVSEQEIKSLKRLMVPEAFKATLEEIKKLDIATPFVPSNIELDYSSYLFPVNGELVTPIEKVSVINLDPSKGQNLVNGNRKIIAYDESVNKFSALEGSAYITSHSMVINGTADYIPLNLLTLYFYTRSKEITNNCKFLKYSEDPEMDSKKDYMKDKLNFLEEYALPNSLLFIDGPLIGGDVYTLMIRAIRRFLDKNVMPIFFVKNSSSNLVTDNLPALKGKFNSDLHWAYRILKQGQRTNFFFYADRQNPDNAKVFCYIKSFNASPQRVECHIQTYNRYKDEFPLVMDLIYYLMLVQGEKRNAQLRPIAIAEKFARETLKLVDIDELMRSAGVVPTMNQERFAW